MSRPIEHRSHRAKAERIKQVERAKNSDGYRSRYDKINAVGFREAWRTAAERDGGLPEEPSDDPASLKRAVVSLARLFLEMQHEWS